MNPMLAQTESIFSPAAMFVYVPLAVMLLAGIVWAVSHRRRDGTPPDTHQVLLQRVGCLRQLGHSGRGLASAAALAFSALVAAARGRLRRDKTYLRERWDEHDEAD